MKENVTDNSQSSKKHKLFLFDCDETLWVSPHKDWISRVDMPIQSLSVESIIREGDPEVFTLRKGTRESFALLSSLNSEFTTLGVISDNHEKPVLDALEAFSLLHHFDSDAINIRLWKGYCAKDQMVEEILAQQKFEGIKRKNVFWFDDKDYSIPAKEIGVQFSRIMEDDSLFDHVLEAVKR